MGVKPYLGRAGFGSLMRGIQAGGMPERGVFVMARTSTQELKQLKVDELRNKLKKKGVSGISALRKDELVKKLVRTLGKDEKVRPSGKASSRGTSGSTSTSRKPSTSKASAKPSTSKAGTSRASVSKTSASKASAKPSTSKASASKASTKPSTSKASTSKTSAAAKPSASRKPSVASASRSYSQQIRSPQDQPESKGRSLTTTNHDVIMQWAQERSAVPATVAGTEHEGRIGVLRLDFPGFVQAGDNSRLRQVSWDQWFRTFDERGLNFIYQQERAGGGQSNFFRLENPQREDA